MTLTKNRVRPVNMVYYRENDKILDEERCVLDKHPNPMQIGSERLQKVLARAGLASRRQAEQYILAGRVKVNGVAASLGQKVGPEDQILFDNQPLFPKEPFQYYFFYKPVGVITSAKDPQGRKTVLDFFTEVEIRVYPVGRLDYNTSGVLLLTNDGELAYRLTHPRYGVDKTYRVWVKALPDQQALKTLRDGVWLEDGKTAPARVELVAAAPSALKRIDITIHEGKNRQVRRMFAAVGHPVQKLERIRFGPLELGGELRPGQYRALTEAEIEAFRQQVKIDKK